MTRIQRALLFSVLLITLLVALSLYFYRLPSQVETRIRKKLEEFLVDTPALQLQECRTGWSGEVAIGRATMRSSAAFGADPILELEALRMVEDPLITLDFPADYLEQGDRDSSTTPISESGSWTRIEATSLDLKIQGGPLQIKAPGHGPTRLWSYQDLLEEAALDGTADARFFFTTPRFEATLSVAAKTSADPARPPLLLRGKSLEVVGMVSKGCLAIRGQARPLLQAATPSEPATPGAMGEFRLLFSPRMGVRKGYARFPDLDMKLIGAGRFLLPAGLEILEEQLRLQGSLDLELEIDPADEKSTTDRGARSVLTASLRLLDTKLQLFDESIHLDHVTGDIVMRGHEVILGSSPGEENTPLLASFAGHDARLTGTLRQEVSTTTLGLGKLELSSVSRLPGIGLPGRIVEALTLKGLAGLTLHRRWNTATTTTGTVNEDGAATAPWELNLETTGASSHTFPALREIRAKLTSSGKSLDEGSITISLEEVLIDGLGAVSGEVSVKSSESLHEIGLGPLTIATDGKLGGQLVVARDGKVRSGEVTGDNVTITLGKELATILVSSMKISFQAPEKESAWTATVTADLGESKLATGRFPMPGSIVLENELRFIKGKIDGTLSSEGLTIEVLQLESARASWRFQGTVSWDGAVTSGLGILALGEDSKRLLDLPADQPATLWIESLSDATSCVFMRIHGSLAALGLGWLPTIDRKKEEEKEIEKEKEKENEEPEAEENTKKEREL